jgi:hypothetical protein
VVVEDVMDHVAEDKVVEGEAPKTTNQRGTLHRKGKVRQTVTYQTVKDYIIQLVQKSFRNRKDVAVIHWEKGKRLT